MVPWNVIMGALSVDFVTLSALGRRKCLSNLLATNWNSMKVDIKLYGKIVSWLKIFIVAAQCMTVGTGEMPMLYSVISRSRTVKLETTGSGSCPWIYDNHMFLSRVPNCRISIFLVFSRTRSCVLERLDLWFLILVFSNYWIIYVCSVKVFCCNHFAGEYWLTFSSLHSDFGNSGLEAIAHMMSAKELLSICCL